MKTNKTLELIIRMDTKRRQLKINDRDSSVMLCLASLGEATRADIFNKMESSHGAMSDSFEKLIRSKKVKQTGTTKNESNNHDVPLYSLTEKGELIMAKILCLSN